MEYDRQLAAWALDRGIELYKIGKRDYEVTVGHVLEVAEMFSEWVVSMSESGVVEKGLDEEAMEAEHDRHVGGEG